MRTRVMVLLALSAMFLGLLAPAALAQPTRAVGLTGDVENVSTAAGALNGVINVTEVAVDSAGNLVASGVFEGTLGGTAVTDTFENAPLQNAGTCRILDLVLGPLHLDLLGLVIDLDTVDLEITGERGPGNLLGNLLCAITGLLDGPGQGGIGSAITNLLRNINRLLSGLLGG